VLKIITGIDLGILFYLIGGYILFFFRNFIVENIYGTHFVIEAEKGVISTKPIKPNFLQIVIILFLYILIIAPCEEAFFRGFILKKIETNTKTIYAVLLSSICFSFYHIPPFLVPIPTIIVFFGYYFTFGLLLAVFLKLFNYSLIPCIIAHGLFNILILML
jgi:membrane protease YdiL (CAAX protease family)